MVFIHCQDCGRKENVKCSKCSSYNNSSPKETEALKENWILKEGLLTSGNAVLEKTNQDLTQEIKILQSSLGLKDIEKSDLQAQIRALNSQLTEKENNSPFQIKINKLERKLNSIKSKLTHWIKLLKKEPKP